MENYIIHLTLLQIADKIETRKNTNGQHKLEIQAKLA